MSNFVISDAGLIVNRLAAADGRVPLAAWDIGCAETTHFLSTQTTEGQLSGNVRSEEIWRGKWTLHLGGNHQQIVIRSQGDVVGQVNRRAAAVLAPLLSGGLIDVELQETQQANSSPSKALYIFAKIGVAGNAQTIREPATTVEARAYVALLACTMKALKAADKNPDRESWDSDSGQDDEVEPDVISTASWHKLPGSKRWDYATGSIGNTVSYDLVDQLGSRTMASLRRFGAPFVGDVSGQDALSIETARPSAV